MKATWVRTTLGEIAEVVSGATPKTSVGEYWGGGIPWVTPKELSGLEGPSIASTERTLTDSGLKSCVASLLPPQSVLLSSRAPIGLVAINDVSMATNQGFKSLVPDDDRVDSKFLYWWLRHHRARLEAMGNGATFKEVSKKVVDGVTIDLPPLEEQRRMAAVLDAAEALRMKRRQALAKLDTLTQAVFHDIFGDPVQNEHGWPTVLLGEVAQFVRGVTFKPKDVVSAGEPGSVVCLRTKNVQVEVDLDDLIAIASTFVKRQEQYLQAGDVLISSANSWNLVGKCCWIPELPWRASFGGFVTALRPTTEAVDRRYLFEWLRHLRIQQLLRSFGRKTTNISNLNLDRCRSMVFPLPPVESQQQFVDAVERIQLHQTSLQESSLTLDTLFASLQQRAFRGEL